MVKLKIMFFFWGRLFAEKILCIFGLTGVQEAVKKLLSRHEKFISNEFIGNRIDIKLSELSPYFFNGNVRNVYEQGTGWHGIDIIILHLLGAEKIFTTDIRDLLAISNMRKVVRYLDLNIDKYDLYKDKIQNLRNNVGLDRDSFLAVMNANYAVTSNFNFDTQVKYHDGIFYDLFYSDSVLQRFKVDDLKKFINNSLLLSGKHTVHVHKIDSKDFFSINNKNIPPLYYLVVNKWCFDNLTCRQLNFQNRLRIFEFVEIFKNYFSIVKTLNEIASIDDIEFVKKNNIRRAYAPNFSAAEVAVKRFDLVASEKVIECSLGPYL